MEVLDYNQLRKEYHQKQSEERQPWKKKEQTQAKTKTAKEQKKSELWNYLVNNTQPQLVG